MKRILLALCIMTGAVGSANADFSKMSDNYPRYQTGNDLYQGCFIDLNNENVRLTSRYIDGVYDTVQASAPGGYHICTPSGVNSRQLYDITCNGLRNHPQDRQVSGAILIYSYLQTAFPCVEVKEAPNTAPSANAPLPPSSIPPAITLPEAPILQNMSHNCEARGGRFDARSRLCSGVTESACASMGGIWHTHLIGNPDCEILR